MRLQVRNQNVIQAGKKSPHEKQHRCDAHGPDVRLLGPVLLSGSRYAGADCHVD